MPSPLLYGRERELVIVSDLLAGLPERGGALVVRGEAGIGKSALLAAAALRAGRREVRILETRGTQTESHLPFAGLHHLLHPVLPALDGLPAPQRAALSAAFGMSDATEPNVLLISLAALNLLADTAATSPVLVMVDDSQWLDASNSAIHLCDRRSTRRRVMQSGARPTVRWPRFRSPNPTERCGIALRR